jgi:TolB-like protein/tetratricopeptide (TPR) repeat protein/predicted Ser/Thr protein kinase
MSDISTLPQYIGRYRVLRQVGEGGMGVVYAAQDERLDRAVAIKVLRADAGTDASALLLREARSAARVTHPNICQIFEVDEEGGRPFFVMELLEGTPLSVRLGDGPLPVPEALEIGAAMLEALDALHARGLAHRDLKPSNVFLTPHGVKLLDFGLAQRTTASLEETMSASLAASLVGTPYYMSPEQVRGEPADARSDLFAAGAILFELVTGRRPFRGTTLVDALNAILREHPPSLGGSAALAAIDRVVQRALAKRTDRRYQSAREMVSDLDRARALPHGDAVPEVRSVTRVAVLPFRLLRSDPEIEFLSLGLADAISTSLAGLDAVIVRSIFVTARIVGEDAWDLRRVAADLDVDLALAGTLLRAGDRVRVNAQLVECATGRTTWSRTLEGSLADVFALQDQVVQQVVASLPVAGADRWRARDEAPRSPVAYRLYLRANQLAEQPGTWPVARDLYLECLREDPEFAHGWANLGRVLRVMAKYSKPERRGSSDVPAFPQREDFAEAERALTRAIACNADLAVAHYYLAQLEADFGRAVDAMRRLLRLARRRRTDAELFAGLTHVCRYCGLTDASLAAHERAVRLDPNARTSVAFTYCAVGDWERILATPVLAQDSEMHTMALWELGRLDEARASADEDHRRPSWNTTLGSFRRTQHALIHGDVATAVALLDGLTGVGQDTAQPFPDGEAIFWVSRLYARAGRLDQAVAGLAVSIDQGYFCLPAFANDPVLAPLRARDDFAALLDRVTARHVEAAGVFADEDGPSLLGVASLVPAHPGDR